MNEFLKIAVICGGNGAEQEVSRISAKAVVTALQESFVSVTTLELDAALTKTLLDNSFDVIYPVLHGPPGEDGTVQGFLETLGMPYVGSRVRASACAMHKPTAKILFKEAGLPTVPGVTVTKLMPIDDAVDLIVFSVGDDIVVKPCDQGSAIGVDFAKGRDGIKSSLENTFVYASEALVEKRIYGREITAGVLDDEHGVSIGLPVVEVVTPKGSWYDFQHRYTQGLSEHVVPANIPADVSAKIRGIAVDAHKCLGCRDLSRSDMVLTSENEVFLLETNTLPGMTPTSLYPDAANSFGISFKDLVKQLVMNAWCRKN